MEKEPRMRIEAVRVQLQLSRAEMAEKMGITLDRYNRLATGECRLLATEFDRLHEISGIAYERISPVTY